MSPRSHARGRDDGAVVRCAGAAYTRRMLLSRMPDGTAEIFASIQGEGITCGMPSVFVRLALCNLQCRWCDTKYTWDWTRYDRAAETMQVGPEDVVGRVLAATGATVRNVVITGGEPLLQQRELADVARRLHDAGLRIEVETGGTI